MFATVRYVAIPLLRKYQRDDMTYDEAKQVSARRVCLSAPVRACVLDGHVTPRQCAVTCCECGLRPSQ